MSKNGLPPGFVFRSANAKDIKALITLSLRSYQDREFLLIPVLTGIFHVAIVTGILWLFPPLHLTEENKWLWEISVFAWKFIMPFLPFFLSTSGYIIIFLTQYRVIEHRGRIVAYCRLNCRAHDSGLTDVFVSPRYRGQGIGSMMVRQVATEAPKPLYLHSFKNKVGFYTRLGFVPVGDRPDSKSQPGTFQLRSSQFTIVRLVLR
jgi:GNAT superfamily N-acetyltransferase